MREKRRDQYVKWHIKMYGRPPNPNFFRGVSDDSVRSVSSTRSNRSERKRANATGLAAIRLQN